MSHNTDYEILRDMFTTNDQDTKFRLVLSALKNAGQQKLFPVPKELTKAYNEGPQTNTTPSMDVITFQTDAGSAAHAFNADAKKRQAVQDAVAAINSSSSATKQWLKTIYQGLVGPNTAPGTGQIDQAGLDAFMTLSTPIRRGRHSNILFFPFQQDKHLWQRMLESIATSSGSASSAGYWTASSGQVKSQNGKLVDASGKDVSVDSDENRKAFEATSGKSNDEYCKLYGFNKGTSRANCVHLVRDCLSGNNVNQCKSYLTDRTFWGSIEKDIKGTQIGNIKHALDKFGFNVENKDGVKVYESPAEWAKHALNGSGFTDTDRQSINANTALMAVLEGMVAAINNNPGVLNAEGTKAPGLSTFRGTTLATAGLLPRVLIGGGAHEEHIRLTNAYNQLTSQVGGGLGMQDGRPVITPERINVDQVTSHERLAAQFEAYVAQLATKGKMVHKDDVTKINSLIADLKNAEEKLNKVNEILSKFNMIYEIDNSIYSAGTFAVEDVEKLVKKHEKLLEKKARKQKYVLAILNGVAGAIVGEE